MSVFGRGTNVYVCGVYICLCVCCIVCVETKERCQLSVFSPPSYAFETGSLPEPGTSLVPETPYPKDGICKLAQASPHFNVDAVADSCLYA